MADLTEQTSDTIYRGQRAVFHFQFPAGTDITGRTFRFTLADAPAGTVLIEKSGADVTQYDTRTAQVVLTPTETWALAETPDESLLNPGGVAVDLFRIDDGSEDNKATAIVPVKRWAYQKT